MTPTEQDKKLEVALMELFCRSEEFGRVFLTCASKEEFAEAVNDGALDHQQAAHEAMQLITADRKRVAKAYGSCEKCYGKGYATWRHGEHYRGQNHNLRNDIKYCDCDRGKQLEKRLERVALEARIETVMSIDAMLRFENIPLHPVQTESLKQYIRQLEAQQEKL